MRVIKQYARNHRPSQMPHTNLLFSYTLSRSPYISWSLPFVIKKKQLSPSLILFVSPHFVLSLAVMLLGRKTAVFLIQWLIVVVFSAYQSVSHWAEYGFVCLPNSINSKYSVYSHFWKGGLFGATLYSPHLPLFIFLSQLLFLESHSRSLFLSVVGCVSACERV